MANNIEKIEALKKKEAQLKAKISALEARAGVQARKEDTRLKVLVGAALLADANLHVETLNLLRAVLPHAVVAQRDRDFLKSKGWLLNGSLSKDNKP